MAKILTLGESLIRLSSDEGHRLMNASRLHLTYGGAEANVAINMAFLDHEVKYATKMPHSNGLAHNLLYHLQSFGVDCSQVLSGSGRLGSYYLETGTGLRATNIIYDRQYSTISMMEKLEWNLDRLFEDVELFHITGVTSALSKSWQKMSVDLILEAKKRGVVVSFDMNYRQTMWTQKEARKVFEQILPHVDILSAGKLDAIHFMDIIEVEGDQVNWQYYMQSIASKYSNLQYIYGTNRQMVTPNSYIMSGYLWDCKKDAGYESKTYEIMQVVDRVGAGDSYAAAILDGIVNKKSNQETVDFGMAAGVLKHTISGDVNLFRRSEIDNFMSNASNIVR